MHMQLNEESGGKVLTIYISDNLIKEDYADLVPEFERLAMVGKNK